MIVVCASGARASLAALTLKTMGYGDVAILDGGSRAGPTPGCRSASTSIRHLIIRNRVPEDV